MRKFSCCNVEESNIIIIIIDLFRQMAVFVVSDRSAASHSEVAGHPPVGELLWSFKILHPDPEADNLLNVTSSSLFTDTLATFS